MRLSQTAYPSAPQSPVAPSSLPSAPEPGRVPYRATPPWGEPAFMMTEEVGVLPGDAPAFRQSEDLHARQNIAFGNKAFELEWWADDQYGAPPPGAPNVQDFQSGHTQVTIINQSAEQGWGTDPAFAWPRYPHMENKAAAYAWGVARRFGEYQAPKNFTPLAERTAQQRDLMLRRALAHRLHGVTVAPAPSVTHTANVPPMVSVTNAPAFGEAGVLPD